MKISVVVPAYNEEKLIAQTLESIRAAAKGFEQEGVGWELIVCDNNSTDRTATMAREAGATVVFEPVNQIGRARNTGAAAATGDWLLFIDADSHPSSELFRDVVKEIRTGRSLAGGAVLRIEDHELGEKQSYSRLVHVWNWISRRLGYFAGSFIFCRRDAFVEVGGFDLQYFASEEIDLAKRLKKVGRREGKRITILEGNPLTTSARKASLYSRGEHARFLLKTLVLGGRPLRKREECFTWYDGRR